MWRGELSDDEQRCSGFEAAIGEIANASNEVKRIGRVEWVHCFPYSYRFAELAFASDCIDGLAVYRNPIETDFDFLVQGAGPVNKSILVIRPFAAGKALSETSVNELIAYSACLPVVEGIIVSCSTAEHLEECVEAALLH
jgi:hypothetical protein